MKKHLYIILFVLPLIGFGQGWEQTYDIVPTEEYGKSIQQTMDGGYIILGNGMDYEFLIKTDSIGNEEWFQIFDSELYNEGESVQQTMDGGYIITGYTSSLVTESFEVFLMKTNENGEEEWSQTFGGTENDRGLSVQQTSDGGYIITGDTGSFGNGGKDVYLIKTNENGEEEWSQTFGGEESDYSKFVQQTSDGGYIITGDTGSFGNGGKDVYLIKTNENGEEEWSQTFGGEESDYSKFVQQTSDGGYIITGDTGSFGNGGKDVYLIKTNENGDSLWTKTFGGIGDDFGRSVQQTSDGGYVIFVKDLSSGESIHTVNGFGISMTLIKTDENGDQECYQTFGTENILMMTYSGQQTLDGGYVLLGRMFDFTYGNSSSEVLLIKTYECNIINTSTIELPTPTSKRELIKTTNILGQENTTIKNQPIIEIYDDGSVEKKYIIE